MQVHEALDRLEQIHDQLTRSEVYRGFRVPTVGVIGLLAFAAAAAQPSIPRASSGSGFVWFWVVVAALSGGLGMAASVHAYFVRDDDFARRRTRRVAAQFLPCVLAGAAITVGVTRTPDLVGYLPGFWAVVFGLGLIAARPHLPLGVGPIGLAYVAAGAFQILRTFPEAEPDGWVVGGVFGVGHLLTALVLWRDLEEDEDE